MINLDFTVEETTHYALAVPKETLAPFALEARAKNEGGAYHELFALLQKAAAHWSDFLIYSWASPKNPDLREWAFVPYTRHSFSWTQQMNVLWRATRGGSAQTDEQCEAVKQYYREKHEVVRPSSPKTDAFCQRKVLDSQRVIGGETVDVLFNYAPLGEEHFLIVPHVHRTDFSEVKQGEFVEAMMWVDNIARHYLNKGLHCHVFHKTGIHAGQTVPHWHVHVIVVDPSQDWKERLRMAWRMILWASPLPPQQLKDRVQKLQLELQDLAK